MASTSNARVARTRIFVALVLYMAVVAALWWSRRDRIAATEARYESEKQATEIKKHYLYAIQQSNMEAEKQLQIAKHPRRPGDLPRQFGWQRKGFRPLLGPGVGASE